MQIDHQENIVVQFAESDILLEAKTPPSGHFDAVQLPILIDILVIETV